MTGPHQGQRTSRPPNLSPAPANPHSHEGRPYSPDFVLVMKQQTVASDNGGGRLLFSSNFPCLLPPLVLGGPVHSRPSVSPLEVIA